MRLPEVMRVPVEMRVLAEIRVTRRDAGTRSHAGKNPQKPETRTPVTRNYPIPEFYTRNPSLEENKAVPTE